MSQKTNPCSHAGDVAGCSRKGGCVCFGEAQASARPPLDWHFPQTRLNAPFEKNEKLFLE